MYFARMRYKWHYPLADVAFCVFICLLCSMLLDLEDTALYHAQWAKYIYILARYDICIYIQRIFKMGFIVPMYLRGVA